MQMVTANKMKFLFLLLSLAFLVVAIVIAASIGDSTAKRQADTPIRTRRNTADRFPALLISPSTDRSSAIAKRR